MTDRSELVWRLLDPATGTFEDYAGCPECGNKDDVIARYEKRMRADAGIISRLEKKGERDDRSHKLWEEAEAIHDWWVLATGHFRAEFGHQDFKDMLPRLKEKKFGAIGVLKAIAGAALSPQEKPLANGRTEKFDSLELICRSPKKLEAFQDRAPDPEDPDGRAWKTWLIDRIESNLTSKEDT